MVPKNLLPPAGWRGVVEPVGKPAGCEYVVEFEVGFELACGEASANV